MSSRRLMNHSLSSDGRSYFSGNDNRRAGSRSYLSSVRSESRSTLCSVMAQITEDTQPTFESTLKSKAVSEEANVKFSCVVSGHPAPDVTWYKDDIQLDRYCGLPKYEISRHEKTHSLQIYSCTLDDAAIYQASAQNSRGIVSCSGVLEVGTMSEYKIHQKYFAKLKLRNENRRREQEEPNNTGKENIPAAREPVRMSSPERVQRKRRSPMESSRRADSPSEERAVEEDALGQTQLEDRLAAPDQVSVADAVKGISDTEVITHKDREVLTCDHDTVDKASSKVLKKAKILTAPTERSKENRTTGRREEMMNKSGASIEKMEVQCTDAQFASVAESDSKTNKKQSENDECMMTECRNTMDITDTKTNEKLSIKDNKSALEDLKRGAQTATATRNKMDKQSIILNKSVSEELKRSQFASLTKTKNKMDIIGTRKSEKQSENVNKSTTRESKRDQSAEASVTEYGRKTDIKDTKNISEDLKRVQGPKAAPVTECKNKIDTKTSLKTNKCILEEAKTNEMVSVAESTNKMDIIDTKKGEKLSVNGNKSVSVESKTALSAQITSVIESSNKINIKGTKTKTENLPVKVNKRALEESKKNRSAQTSSLTEQKNKIGIKDTRKTEKQSINTNKNVSEESKKDQGAQITSVTELKTKLDITETKKGEKQSETPKESASELKKAQKPIAAQKQPSLSVSMTTQANEVVENTKLTKPSGKGTSNFEAPDPMQNCNSSFIDNKLKDFDDHRNSNPVGTCVRIFSNSCGGNDVNVDTGERNASARSLRSLATGDTHTEPAEPPTQEDVPPIRKEVALELKEQPTLIHEVTVSFMETPSSCPRASQEQEMRNYQSLASTKSNTLVSGHQNAQPSEKNSSGHVSHKLQGSQVKRAMSFSLENDILSNVCEEDRKAENQLIKESDEPKSETSMSLNNKKENEISKDEHVLNTTSEEKSTVNSKHSSNPKTQFVQSMNGSSVSDVQMKDTKAPAFQITSAVTTDYVAKKAMQEQTNVTTSEVPYLEMQSHSVNKCTDGPGSSTFLNKHSKALPTDFTIPTIYITDVDNNQNSTEKAHTANYFEIRNEPIAATSNVRNNNTVNQVSETSDVTDTDNRTTAVKSESLNGVKFDLSLLSQSSECNSQENVTPNHIQLNETSRQQSDDDIRTKTDTSEITETSHLSKKDLNLRRSSESFVKQLKEAALDLGKSSQPSIKFNDTQNMTIKDNVKAIQAGAFKKTVPLKTTEDQDFSSTAARSDLPTRTDQKTTFPKTRTEKSEMGVGVCLEKANRDTYQEDKLSLKTQHPSPSQSASNSPLMTSLETHSPRLSRRTVPADPPKPAGNENIKTKSTEKDKENPFKVPQVIRKIRPEVFDASGHLKLWCQFFNIISDSTIRWYKDEVEIAEINRSAGDETQLCLAIIQMSKRDCGVYRCTITNQYGKDSTEYPLSTEFLSNMFLREEHHEVGEEIEMTPLIFGKGLADPGCWGSKFYGRVTTEEAQVGLGCEHKTRRLKVIYGLDPVFESGGSCFMKVRSPIVYESREETVLAERNLQITKQDCRIQNMAREYFKIFATETRVIESFGAALEVIPLYFTYCPASSVPYATVEAELKGVYLRYCGLDSSGSLIFNEKSEVGQKCSALQHWIHQWTNGNVLFSRLEGVDTILTNIGIAVRTKGYQGFPCEANPKVFHQFQIQHQCNYYCGLLNLKPLKAPETLQTSARSKGSSSPLPQRRVAPGSSSPQTPRKATKSPKVSCKLNPQTST